MNIVLLVGSDSRDDLDNLEGFGAFAGQRADVVMVLIRVEGGAAILSVPRDLLVDDPCRQRETSVNALLAGCPDGINGPTLLTLAVGISSVRRWTTRDGRHGRFPARRRRSGWLRICVTSRFGTKVGLDLPPGAPSPTASDLAWIRSRHTQELTDRGGARSRRSDLARNERQRQFVIDMMGVCPASQPQQLASGPAPWRHGSPSTPSWRSPTPWAWPGRCAG